MKWGYLRVLLVHILFCVLPSLGMRMLHSSQEREVTSHRSVLGPASVEMVTKSVLYLFLKILQLKILNTVRRHTGGQCVLNPVIANC